MSLSVPITPAQEDALRVLRDHQRFLLVGHVRPDGDCVGSQAALARVLTALGKQVRVVNPDEPAPALARLTRGLSFEAFVGAGVPDHEVCVLLDINELSRCGRMEGALRAAPSLKVVVDHHVPAGDEGADGPWWDAAFVDVGASATGLLVARIAGALGVALDRPAAEAVFTALVTDTGWFKYSNTDPETMALASELVALGVEPNALYEHLYQHDPPDLPHAIASVLGGLEYECEGRIAVIEHGMAARGGAALEDADPVLDIARAVDGVEVVLYVRELEDGRCKLSARSKTDFDVNALAGKFGGGGHTKAAGATIEGTLSEVRCRLVEAATRMLQKQRARAARGEAVG